MELFQTERFDPAGDPEMQWDFPVTPGQYEVRLYFAEIYSGAQSVGARKFDVSIEGAIALNDYDIFADVGGFKAVMKEFQVNSDSNLDIDLGHVVENPAIKGIEILGSSGTPIGFGKSALAGETSEAPTTLQWGPDGRLYVGMGDGGAGGDPENRAQNMGALLGKLLSINVATKGVKIEALGLRNPWRFSFDRANWNLWIADVGQNAFEEIDFTPRAQQRLLLNYGWDVYEGRSRFESKRPSRGRLVFPVATYGRANGCSVSGGFVYRGSSVPAARGRYFYGDFCSGIVWSLTRSSGKTRVRREPFQVDSLASFGEDARGELYLVSLEGSVYRLAG
jgi:hypothetical protein